MGQREAHPEGVAGLLRLLHPHRPHHQAGQLLAEAENKPREPKVQIRGELVLHFLVPLLSDTISS